MCMVPLQGLRVLRWHCASQGHLDRRGLSVGSVTLGTLPVSATAVGARSFPAAAASATSAAAATGGTAEVHVPSASLAGPLIVAVPFCQCSGCGTIWCHPGPFGPHAAVSRRPLGPASGGAGSSGCSVWLDAEAAERVTAAAASAEAVRVDARRSRGRL